MSDERDFPKRGEPHIIKINGVWQEETYIADQTDGEFCAGERFWSRDDLDECPSFDYENDDWISIREVVNTRLLVPALEAENERLKARVAELETAKDLLFWWAEGLSNTAQEDLPGFISDGYSMILNLASVLNDGTVTVVSRGSEFRFENMGGENDHNRD